MIHAHALSYPGCNLIDKDRLTLESSGVGSTQGGASTRFGELLFGLRADFHVVDHRRAVPGACFRLLTLLIF